jgi:small subunit ribosomal protein S4
MSRIKAIEKKERALGVKLFLKAERCNSPKCVTVRHPYRPGVHGQKRHTVSEYGKQWREKQKIQIVYGLTNRQMQNLFKKMRDPNKIIKVLESRLDRVVHLLGLAASPRIARQLISHGHTTVNGRKMTVPSYYVRIGDAIGIRSKSRQLEIFEDLPVRLKQYEPPSWLKLDKEKFEGQCVAEPGGERFIFPFDINLVVQFYSR